MFDVQWRVWRSVCTMLGNAAWQCSLAMLEKNASSPFISGLPWIYSRCGTRAQQHEVGSFSMTTRARQYGCT